MQKNYTISLFILAGIFLSACNEPVPVAPKAKSTEQAAVLVKVATVHNEEIPRTVLRTGTLRALESTQIITQEEGRITRLPYYPGDAVKSGDLLYELDDTLLRAELNKALAQRKQAEEDVRRNTTLQRKGVVSEDELNRAITALDVARAEEALLRTRLGYTRQLANSDGVVTERLAEPGDIAQRFEHLLTLINPHVLITDVSVSELVLPALHVGAEVKVSIDALGNSEYNGRILRIHPTVDPVSRQGIVEIMLAPSPPGSIPGQLCRVSLSGDAKPRLLIPFNALRSDADGEFVYRIDAQDRVQRVAVDTGDYFNERIEIRTGLQNGDRIVTRGFFDLKPGSLIRTEPSVSTVN